MLAKDAQNVLEWSNEENSEDRKVGKKRSRSYSLMILMRTY